jgi:hypothetical protein
MQQRLKTSFQSGCWLATAVGRVTLLRVNLTFHLTLDIFSSAEKLEMSFWFVSNEQQLD